MTYRAVTGLAHGHGRVGRLCKGDEVAQIRDFESWTRCDDKGDLAHQRNRRKVLVGVVRHRLIERLVVGKWPGSRQTYGVAVGSGLRYRVRADIACCSAAVINNKLLVEHARKVLRDGPGYDIGAAACWKRHDHLHGTIGPVILGPGRNRKPGDSGDRCCRDGKSMTPKKMPNFHKSLLAGCL